MYGGGGVVGAQYCLCGLVITGGGYPVEPSRGVGGGWGRRGWAAAGKGGRGRRGSRGRKKSPHWAGFVVDGAGLLGETVHQGFQILVFKRRIQRLQSRGDVLQRRD